MNIYVALLTTEGREAFVWLCVDRIEGTTVVLTDDDERIYRLDRAVYVGLTDRDPVESDVLNAQAEGEKILSAAYDEAQTNARKEAARARLNRLFGRK